MAMLLFLQCDLWSIIGDGGFVVSSLVSSALAFFPFHLLTGKMGTRPLMAERGVDVDHSTINRWTIKYSPLLEEAFHRRKRPVWVSWRMDETYVKVKGEWRYLYRAVDKHGQTMDFLLTEHRDKEAALRFLKKAIRRHGLPETITIDGSDANEAAIKSYNEEHGTHIAIRQVKYLNNPTTTFEH
jgi:putative transposase